MVQNQSVDSCAVISELLSACGRASTLEVNQVTSLSALLLISDGLDKLQSKFSHVLSAMEADEDGLDPLGFDVSDNGDPLRELLTAIDRT